MLNVEFHLKNGKVIVAQGVRQDDEVVGMMQDVSAVKTLENQLRHAQKMESLGILAGGVAHDFNNILCGIILPAEMALEMVEPDEEVHEELEMILESGQRAQNLVTQLLLFSRRGTTQAKNIEVNHVLKGLAQMLKRLLPSAHTLRLTLCQGPCVTRMDASALEQVVTNLVVNARDATPKGGEISLETRLLADEGLIAISVSDDGHGIPKELLKNIFDPFFTTKEVGKGTGLGLSVCYGIVHDAGGEMSVQSTVGEGSCFSVTLPMLREQSSSVASDEVASRGTLPRGEETLVIVSSDETLITVLVRCLKPLGYRVSAFRTPPQTLYFLESSTVSPGLLIIDTDITAESGRDLTAEARLVFPELPALLMSGGGLDSDEMWSVGKRNFFIAKPFTRETFATVVRAAIDG